MLVCVREFGMSELSALYRNSVGTQHFERYYSLHAREDSLTIVDVVDSRARKTFNYDVFTRSSAELYDQIVEPLLMTVLTPNRASQAVVVIDGQSSHRRCTLLDPVEGILTRVVCASISHPDVISVSISAVTQEDNNTLTDIMPDPNDTVTAEQPTILEDTHEQFTSVEVAHYIQLDCEATWNNVLHRITAAFAELKHQVFSLIFGFHESTGLPNTTMQFVSFTVNEVTRGMKSSRHAVSSAAGLLECRSPTLTFTATKLLFLLKSTLLGQQPGAWVACFSPVSPLRAAEHESFQEAFAVAQTAARLYSSRIAVLNSFIPASHRDHSTPTVGVGNRGASDDKDAHLPAAESDPVTTAAAALGEDPDEKMELSPIDASCDVSTNPRNGKTADSGDFHYHLVHTPGVTEGRAAESSSGLAGSSHVVTDAEVLHTVKQSCAVQTEARPHVHHVAEERMQHSGSDSWYATQYELGTYCSVMERALLKLRVEVRDAREQARREKSRRRETESRLDSLRSEYDATVRDNNRLYQELCSCHKTDQRQARQQQQTDQPITVTRKDSCPEPQLQSNVALLEARVQDLTDLVAFHQKEIQAHVSHEQSYRQRILDLESEVRKKELELIADKAALKELRHAADIARAAAKEASVPVRTTITNVEIAQRELQDVEERATELEYRLREALDALQSERNQRLQLEHLIKSREKDEGARAASEQTDVLVQNLQRAYETQLRDLKAEMSDLRGELAQSGTQSFVQRDLGDASSYAATPVSRQGCDDALPVRPQQMSTPRVPPYPDPSHTHFTEAHKGSSVLSYVGTQTTKCSSQQRRPPNTKSFEEFMREDPHYQVHRASFLRRRAHTPAP